MKPHQPFFRSIFFSVPVLSLLASVATPCLFISTIASTSAWAYYRSIGASESLGAMQWNEMSRIVIIFSGVSAVLAFGAIRLAAFHPVWRKEYADFLANTPYDGSQPLPFGPVGFIWKDLVYMAVAGLCLFAFCVVHEINGWDAAQYAASIYAFPYLLMGAWTLIRSGRFRMGYFMAFALIPLAMVEGAAERLVLLGVLIIAANRALVNSLAPLPWRPDPGLLAGRSMQYNLEKLKFVSEGKNAGDIGWPFQEMPEPQPFVHVSWRHAVAISAWLLVTTMTCTWRLRSALPQTGDGLLIPLHVTLSWGLLIIAAIVAASFAGANIPLQARYRSNRTIPARIASGRLFVAAFDRVHLASIFLGTAILFTFKAADDFPYLVPFLAGAAPLVARWSVPDPKAFALTAPAIIRPTGMTSERFKRL